MSSSSPTSAALPRLHQALIQRLIGQHPGTVPDVSLELWGFLVKALVNLIGTDGFQALYDRSVHLASADFPWLALSAPVQSSSARFAGLQAALQAHEPAEARQASALLLLTFTEVLASLIGESLTVNIVRAAWGTAYDKAAKEIP